MNSRMAYFTGMFALAAAAAGVPLLRQEMVRAQAADPPRRAASRSASEPNAALKSAVQRELDAMYRERGMQPPAMDKRALRREVEARAAMVRARERYRKRKAAEAAQAGEDGSGTASWRPTRRKRSLWDRIRGVFDRDNSRRTARSRRQTAPRSSAPRTRPAAPPARLPRSVSRKAPLPKPMRKAATAKKPAGRPRTHAYTPRPDVTAPEMAAKNRPLSPGKARGKGGTKRELTAPEIAAKARRGSMIELSDEAKAAQREKPSLLERIFPFARKDEKPEPAEAGTPGRKAPTPSAAKTAGRTKRRRKGVPAPAAEEFSPPPLPTVRRTPKPSSKPNVKPIPETTAERKPAAKKEEELPLVPAGEGEEEPVAESSPKAAKEKDPLANAFPDEPESQADGESENPFTGLKLSGDEPQAGDGSEPETKPEPEKTAAKPIPSDGEESTPMIVAEPEPKKTEKPVEKTAKAPAKLPTDPRMRKIATREGLGLKGFCPVVLRDRRELRDAQKAFTATYKGRTYHLSSAEAKRRFELAPEKYAPVAGGYDVIVQAVDGAQVPGKLDHAVWYKDRLHLFSSRETLVQFVRSLDATPAPRKVEREPQTEAKPMPVEDEGPTIEPQKRSTGTIRFLPAD